MSKQSIDKFKAELAGGGVRPTMFEVSLTFPTNTAGGAETAATDTGIFLCKASQLPASNIGNIDVPFRGRKLKVAGDRTFDDWTVTITNDQDFTIRKAMEKWSELVQNHNYALGSNTLDDYFSTAIVRQLDRQGEQLRAYQFNGIWPTTVAAIDLDFDTENTIEEFECTFAVQYWSAKQSGDPVTRNQPTDPLEFTNSIRT